MKKFQARDTEPLCVWAKLTLNLLSSIKQEEPEACRESSEQRSLAQDDGVGRRGGRGSRSGQFLAATADQVRYCCTCSMHDGRPDRNRDMAVAG